MEKIQKSKKTLIIVGMLIALVIVLLVVAKSCGKSAENNSKGSGKEVILESEDGETEDGLSVMSPEDADASDSEGNLEFIGPDGATTNNEVADDSEVSADGQATTGSETTSRDENNGDADDTDGTEKNEGAENNGNTSSGLGEEERDTGKYGQFF